MGNKKQQSQMEMKIENRRAVMEQVKDEEYVSRTSLARELRMSPTSMSRICGDLMELGLIHEIQKAESAGVGRKAVWLKKNPDAFYSLGILIRQDFIGCIIADYGEKMIFQKKWEEEVPQNSRRLIETVAQHIKEVETQQPAFFKKVEAVGISFPGIIDVKTGMIRYSDLFGWENTAFAVPLSEMIGIPCYMARDIKASVIEEYHCGGRKEKSIGFLSLSQEVGAAWIQDGNIINGADGICGEIGHKTVIFHGRKCTCGKQGCAAAYLTEASILKQAEESGHFCAPLFQLAQAYERKESWAETLLQKTAEIAALLVEDMIVWNNPEKIVLGGRTVRLFPELLDLVQEEVAKSNAGFPAATRIEGSINPGNESMMGAAYIAMDENEKVKINSLKEM